MKAECSVAGCEKLVHSKGLCDNHYRRQLRRDPSRPKCKVRGCEKLVYAKGSCLYHYEQQKERDVYHH